MNHSILTLILFSFCCYSCSSNQQDKQGQIHHNSGVPEFTNGDKIIDSLKLAYNCEGIEFENWEDDDKIDSSLTVCFINSNRVPKGDESFSEFEGIARQIKKAAGNAKSYKSYYIVFVKRDSIGGIATSSHTAGTDIPDKFL